MKKYLSAFLLGMIAAFVVLQLLYFRQFGFSFLVYLSWIDPWYVGRALSILALVLIILLVKSLFQNNRFMLELSVLQLLLFFFGIFIMAIAYIVWRLMVPDSNDDKFTPYIILPCFYFIALASVYVLACINLRRTRNRPEE